MLEEQGRTSRRAMEACRNMLLFESSSLNDKSTTATIAMIWPRRITRYMPKTAAGSTCRRRSTSATGDPCEAAVDVAKDIANDWAENHQGTDDHDGDQHQDQGVFDQSLAFFFFGF
jgi:hypothetical protein